MTETNPSSAANRPDRNRYDRARLLRRLTAPIEAWQVRRFGRSGLSVLFRTPVLVLHTTGRRTGRERATPLACEQDGDGCWLVVGGAGGQATLPDWVANLRARPEVAVTVARRRRNVAARELTGEERDETWARLRQVWPRIDTYQRRAGRPVPVFRLTERPEVDPGS